MNQPLYPLALNYPATKQLEVFAVDDDGAIKVSWKTNNGPWQPPYPLTPVSFAQPGTPLSGAHYPPGSSLEVFSLGQGRVHVLWKAPHVQDHWQGPSVIATDFPTPASAHSAAVHYPPVKTLEVFGVGTDRGVYGIWKSPDVQNHWQHPYLLAGAAGLAPPGSPLAAVHCPPGDNLEVFVVGDNGAVNGLWKAPHVQNIWQPPYALAGATGIFTPGARLAATYYPLAEQLEVFAVDRFGALTVLWKHGTGGWNGPTRLTGNGFAPPGAPVTAVHYPPNDQLEVHVVDGDGRIWVLWKAHNRPWAPQPHPLTDTGAVVAGTPLTSAFYPVNDQLEAFLGDGTWFSRVLWKSQNKAWAPCLVPLGPRSGTAFSPAANTQRLAQVTGTSDFLAAGVRGVDLGANTTHRDNHYVFLGDVPALGRPDGPVPDADAVARISNLSRNGITLDLVRSGRYFAPFTIRRPDGSLLVPQRNQTPTGAFSDGTFAYVFVLVFDRPDHVDWPVPVSYLARSADPGSGQPYDQVFRWSEFKFWQVSPHVVDNTEVPGLPSASGRGVVLFGGGDPGGRRSAVHLAWMPLTPGSTLRTADIRYHRGAAGWSSPGDEASAQPLWYVPDGYTSVSAAYVPDAGRWVVLYSKARPIEQENRPTGAVVARTAPAPTGPWSAEITVFDPCRDGAFGTFMHWPDMDDLDQRDPSYLAGSTGWAYGAFILEPLTEWHPEDDSVTLHYLMSTSRPYQVQHMRSRFRIG
ncbi:DUF4185 domain-containing protein [Streptomyces sp. NPDC037389]|uniref:DUF4185 domain-containing protein n=1 Tax=Streptomyces sp. NPDC037389 TaxID=3155369 RepID=UPI0033ECFCDA